MNSYWREKIYKALLRLNSVVSYFLRVFAIAFITIVCFPTFVIILMCLVVGLAVANIQHSTNRSLRAWAYGKTEDIHE